MEEESPGSLMPSDMSISASKDALKILVVLKSKAVDLTQNDYLLCVLYLFSKISLCIFISISIDNGNFFQDILLCYFYGDFFYSMCHLNIFYLCLVDNLVRAKNSWRGFLDLSP